MESTPTSYIQTGMIKWHVRQIGNPDLPKVLCLHGMFGDSRDWSILHSYIDKYFCIIAPDFPAHGKTKLTENLSTHDLLESLADLIKQQEVAAVLGYSMGGRLLMQIMAKLEAEKSSLHYYILSADPGLSQDCQNPRRLENDQLMLRPWIEGKISAEHFFQQWYSAPLFGGKILENKSAKKLMSTRLELHPKELSDWLNISSVAVMPSTLEHLLGLQDKITYIIGSNDLKYRPYAKQLSVLAPDIKSIEIPDTFHGIPWESPSRLGEILISDLPN